MDDLRMADRDPRINFNVCVSHACEEAMEALQAFDELEQLLQTNISWPPANEDAVLRDKANKTVEHFMEETSDLIYAARRLAFYAKVENKVLTRTIEAVLNGITGDYVGFKSDPVEPPFKCAIGVALYANHTLRTQGVGYPTRHAFEDEFVPFLYYLQETLRLCVVQMIPKLVWKGILHDEHWKDQIKNWIVAKVVRKYEAELAEGNDYYDGGFY